MNGLISELHHPAISPVKIGNNRLTPLHHQLKCISPSSKRLQLCDGGRVPWLVLSMLYKAVAETVVSSAVSYKILIILNPWSTPIVAGIWIWYTMNRFWNNWPSPRLFRVSEAEQILSQFPIQLHEKTRFTVEVIFIALNRCGVSDWSEKYGHHCKSQNPHFDKTRVVHSSCVLIVSELRYGWHTYFYRVVILSLYICEIRRTW